MFSESDRHVKVLTKKRIPSKRCKQAQSQQQDPEEWATDDSDWDYSDEETRARRRKSSKSHLYDFIPVDDYEITLGCLYWGPGTPSVRRGHF